MDSNEKTEMPIDLKLLIKTWVNKDMTFENLKWKSLLHCTHRIPGFRQPILHWMSCGIYPTSRRTGAHSNSNSDTQRRSYSPPQPTVSRDLNVELEHNLRIEILHNKDDRLSYV